MGRVRFVVAAALCAAAGMPGGLARGQINVVVNGQTVQTFASGADATLTHGGALSVGHPDW